MNWDKQLLKRKKLADKAGEGAYWNITKKCLVAVKVTFYPTVKRWLTEDGKRRFISEDELRQNYTKFEV